jgi:hypothetical protein
VHCPGIGGFSQGGNVEKLKIAGHIFTEYAFRENYEKY